MSQDENYMPVLPSRNTVIFPKMIFPMYIGRELSLASLEEAASSNGEVLVVAQKAYEEETPRSKDMYKVGVVCKILQVLKLQSSNVKVLMEGTERVKITKFHIAEHSIRASYKILPDKISKKRVEADFDILKRSLLEHFQDYVRSSRKMNNDVIESMVSIHNPGTLCDAISSHMNVTLEKKQSLLEATDVYKRMEMLLALVQSEIEFINTENKLKHQVKNQLEKNQREYYLNEQLKAIKKELGDDDAESEITKLAQSIEKSKMPKEAMAQAKSELKKLKTLNAASTEASIIKTYIELLAELPWNRPSKLKKNIAAASKILAAQHYGLDKIKERILEHIAVGIRTGKSQGAVLCLSGPPGVGKTSLAKSLAEATGRQFVKISLGGLRDEAEIRGHRRTYVGAMPGKIIQAMKKANTSNPLILFDEIDKINNDYRGDPASALLEVLDPEQNASFNDHYLGVDFDLSNVMFVCTSNSTNMSRPLLDRMEIIHVSGYTAEEKLKIAQEHLIAKTRLEHGLKEDEVQISDNAISDIIRYYTRESGVRGLKKNIAKIMRKSLMRILESKTDSLKIEANNLEELLGPRKFMHNALLTQASVGICNGLAYTEVGGDLLHIEVAIVPGKGEIKTTGKLGDVMKESVFAAITYIRSKSTLLNINNEIFTKNDVHVHVPEGAVPKDGPSAGIAIFSAVLSAVSGKPIKNNIAMTGEITLRGNVLAIGGLKEKALAAVTSGVEQIFIPKDNEKDIAELPETARRCLQITPIDTVSELLPVIFSNSNIAQTDQPILSDKIHDLSPHIS